MGKPKVPNTISDKQWAGLRRRGGKANSWFSAKAIAQRRASELQRKNAGNN
jgi:hypothetical protein